MIDIQKLDHQELLEELINLVENTKSKVVSFANSSLTLLFWKIGNKVLNKTLENSRAEYGKQIVVTLSRELESKYGRNY